MNANLSDAQWQEIDAALFSGFKIQAINLYRQHTGTDLLEAKQAVEHREQSLRETMPERFSPRTTGCRRAAVFVLTITVLALLACLLPQ